jgi:hypothetical protein
MPESPFKFLTRHGRHPAEAAEILNSEATRLVRERETKIASVSGKVAASTEVDDHTRITTTEWTEIQPLDQPRELDSDAIRRTEGYPE